MQSIKYKEFNDIADLIEKRYVIDGSNIAFEKRTSKNKPKFSNLIKLTKMLEQFGIINFRIFCDRSLFYCINDRQNYSEFIKKGIITESPEGKKADIFILQYALVNDCYIISNDKFKEFYPLYKKDWIESKRISFRIIDNEIYFDKLIIKRR